MGDVGYIWSIWEVTELISHLRKFQSFQDSQGFVLVLFSRLLESVPVGVSVVFTVFPCERVEYLIKIADCLVGDDF